MEGCAIMTVENDNKVCGRHKKSRIELGCTEMTVENENNVCGMNTKSRMEL